ncbi:MAG: DNA cytosine methyltransferase, partial [Nostoc sp.]
LVTYQNKFAFIDLFAGIGGFRIALQKLGGQFLGYFEIDKQAIKVYQQNFISYLNKDEIELGDITKISELASDVDIQRFPLLCNTVFLLTPSIDFSFEDVPHSCRKCCSGWWCSVSTLVSCRSFRNPLISANV